MKTIIMVGVVSLALLASGGPATVGRGLEGRNRPAKLWMTDKGDRTMRACLMTKGHGWRFAVALAVVVASVTLGSAAGAQTVVGYGMDETSGNVMLGSGGAPNGTIFGDVALGVPGVSGTAYAFNQNVGSCDSSFNVTGTGYVAIPSSAAFAVGTQPFSFSLSLNTTAVPDADSGTSANCDFDMWRRASRWKMELVPKGTAPNLFGVPRCRWSGVLNGLTVHVALTANTTPVTDGAWHQVTCSRADDGERLIVDGVVVASSTVNLGAINSSATVFVGTQQPLVDFYQGALDDLTFTVG